MSEREDARSEEYVELPLPKRIYYQMLDAVSRVLKRDMTDTEWYAAGRPMLAAEVPPRRTRKVYNTSYCRHCNRNKVASWSKTKLCRSCRQLHYTRGWPTEAPNTVEESNDVQ